MARENIVQFGDWISEGWNLFTKQWQTWGLLGLVFFAPVLVVIGVLVLAFVLTVQARPQDATLIISFGILGVAGFLCIMGWISYAMAGMFQAAFKQLEGKAIAVSDIFSGGPYFFRFLVANILIGLLTIAGALLCYFPAFLVAGLTYFTLPLIVRRNVTALQALSESRNLASRDWFMFTLFAFVVGLIAQVGVYACYIGIVFTLPLQYTIGVVAYRDCFEPQAKAPSAVDALYQKACRRCGASIPVNAAFCDRCGAGQV